MTLTFFNIKGQLVNLSILTAFIETYSTNSNVVLVGNQSMRLEEKKEENKEYKQYICSEGLHLDDYWSEL